MYLNQDDYLPRAGAVLLDIMLHSGTEQHNRAVDSFLNFTFKQFYGLNAHNDSTLDDWKTKLLCSVEYKTIKQ